MTDYLLAGRYRLTDRIAAGGMGEVWRAEDVLLKHPRLKDHPAILHALCLSQLRPHSDA